MHSHTDLSGVQKFNYLVTRLKGEASQLLDGFACTNENYEEAIALGKETYGQHKRFIGAHLHAPFGIPCPKASAADLRKFWSSYMCP